MWSVEDPERCYRAVQARDARFDGLFYVGVTSTGIYCRPSCPARTPKRENTRFFPTAASAQTGGFRPCLRCRPDATPGSPQWDVRGDVVGRVMRLIADGVVDREGVEGLARRVGYSTRHLNRVLTAEAGAAPLALARAQRAQSARTLLESGDMPIVEVAFAAGFSSVRQFNDTIGHLFGRSPREIRRRGAGSPMSGDLVLRLPYRAPFDLAWSLAYLGSRTVAGLESVDGPREEPVYRRTLSLPHGPGRVELAPGDGQVVCRLDLSDLRDLSAAVRRCRHLLDLDADPAAVVAHLGRDPVLGHSVTRRPGLRLPRCTDGFELAARAVLAQQVSLAAARNTTAKIVAQLGRSLGSPDGRPDRAFPTPVALASADPATLGMPATRAVALVALASQVAAGTLDLGPGADRSEVAARLISIRGIGPWTASVVALKGLGDPDVYCDGDLAARRGLAHLGADPRRVDPQRWSPWRSYAMAHIWGADPVAHSTRR